MNWRIALLGGLVAGGLAGAAHAGSVSDTLYYTTFNGGSPDVWSVLGTYTGNGTSGNGTFSLTGDTNIATTLGADGLVFNPSNGDLLVGGQGTGNIYQVDPNTHAVTAASAGMNAYELTVDPSTNVVWSGGAEGSDTHISSTPINPFSASGSPISVTGSNTTVTHITFAPGLPAGDAFYTSEQNNALGIINLTTGVTSSFLTGDAFDHGMQYDPFTGDLILAGNGEIGQIDPTTHALIASCSMSGNFDQGAVDGQGHLFWADNNGNMLFVDYSNTRNICSGSNFVSDSFFKSQLDDIAPLIGAGGSNVPEPASLTILGMGLLGLGGLRRRRG